MTFPGLALKPIQGDYDLMLITVEATNLALSECHSSSRKQEHVKVM